MKHMIVIMGVAGSGKTAIGEALKAKTGINYIDGDALHPKSNIEKMSSGVPLADEDRWPWLKAVGETMGSSDESIAIGCSALKRKYRDHIRQTAGGPVTFVYLEGSKELIAERMAKREGHFMPTKLLDSQFADLEPPMLDENYLAIDISKSIAKIANTLVDRFKPGAR